MKSISEEIAELEDWLRNHPNASVESQREVMWRLRDLYKLKPNNKDNGKDQTKKGAVTR